MKNSLVLLLGCAIVLSTGVASAQDGRQTRETHETRGTREPQADPIPRDGDYSWCEETDGGLECGGTACGEDSNTSECETWVTNTSHEYIP